MRIAAIDIGTNSLHMIIVRATPDGSFEVIGREKDMVRLGAGGLEGRALSDGAMGAALQTLARFKRLAASRDVEDIVAVATSAVREAANGGEFLEAIARQTGIRARIITGVEEALLIHRAAVHGVDVGAGSAVVVDIGGGSTEITLGNAAGAQAARSFHLGVIRLAERYVTSDPISDADERRMARHVANELGDYAKTLAAAGVGRVIGTSGTILGLGGLALGETARTDGDPSLHHRRVSARAIRRLRRELAGLSLEERMALPGLDPRRADLVVSGAILLDVILRQLGADELTLCEISLREGVILYSISRRRLDIARVDQYPDIRRRSVVELAQRCHYAADHAAQVSRLAVALFDQTRHEHGLDDRARSLLDLAGLLHDVGEHISYERHHRHSYYLIKHGELRGFEPDEIEMLALIARYHRRGRPKRSHPGFGALPRASRQAVRWLSAMVRLAEGLDRSRAQVVRDITLAPHGREWTLRMAADGDVELERWAAQRHVVALEALLGAPVRVLAARRAREAQR